MSDNLKEGSQYAENLIQAYGRDKYFIEKPDYIDLLELAKGLIREAYYQGKLKGIQHMQNLLKQQEEME